MSGLSLVQGRMDPLAPVEERYTTWHNPTDHQMHVDVFLGTGRHNNNESRPTRFYFEPHKDTSVPSRFDDAIQKVQCTRDECRQAGIFCRKGHKGTIVGGSAPQLQNKGSSELAVLPDHLDPLKAAKKEAEAQVAAQDIARRAAEQAMLLAKKQAMDAEEALEAATRPEPKAKK